MPTSPTKSPKRSSPKQQSPMILLQSTAGTPRRKQVLQKATPHNPLNSTSQPSMGTRTHAAKPPRSNSSCLPQTSPLSTTSSSRPSFTDPISTSKSSPTSPASPSAVPSRTSSRLPPASSPVLAGATTQKPQSCASASSRWSNSAKCFLGAACLQGRLRKRAPAWRI